MKHRSQSNLQWIEYSIFSKFSWLKHGTFYRYGGASQSPYNSLNFSTKAADPMVETNTKCVCKVLGASQIRLCNQVHGVHIHNLDYEPNSLSTPEADALITSKPGIAIGILHADCQAAIFLDPTKPVLCVAHAGWRGQAKFFYSQIVAYFQTEYGSKAKDLHVSISPSLGPNHAKFNPEIDPLSSLQLKHQIDASPYFNLWDAARDELENSGVIAENIEIASICTFDHRGCFSHRRDGKNTGRNLTTALVQI